MVVSNFKRGFTIVELLIVIVVIAILATITFISYNGIKQRAQDSTTASYLVQNAKTIINAASSAGAGYVPASVMTPGLTDIKPDNSKYRVITYCGAQNEFTLAVETLDGGKYYTKNGAAMVTNSSLDSFQPCATTGIANAYTTYLNLPAQCASEGGNCTFSGTATIVYGSAAQGRFNRQADKTSPVTCNNLTFGDPASGFAKACYVYPN